MAKYNISGNGSSLFEAYGTSAPLKGNLLYVKATEFGIRNADGTFTYVYGSDFVFDSASGEFTGGTIANIRHFDAGGRYIDDITGLQVPVSSFQTALANASLASLLLQGDDILQAVYLRGSNAGANLDGYAGDDSIYGSIFGDILAGGSGDDVVGGRRGDDTLSGNGGNDVLKGGMGNDTLYGDDAQAFGFLGKDFLSGGLGKDTLDGGRGDDILLGGAGRDWLTGGISGDDMLTGGKNGDTFVFTYSADGIRPIGAEWGNDTITDFEVGLDRLSLSDTLLRPVSYSNDADGNAVIRIDGANSVTLIGVDASQIPLDDLLA